MPTMSDVAREAVCSALYNMPFASLFTERDDPATGVPVTIFRLNKDGIIRSATDNDPNQMNVYVMVEDVVDFEFVHVAAKWINISGGRDNPLVCEQTFRIPASNHTEEEVREACGNVIVRVLELFKGVLSGDYVLQPIEEFAPPKPEAVPDEDDLARSDEEVGRE